MIVRRKFDFLKLHVNLRLVVVVDSMHVPLGVGSAVGLLLSLGKSKLDHGEPMVRPLALVAQLLERSRCFLVPAFDKEPGGGFRHKRPQSQPNPGDTFP